MTCPRIFSKESLKLGCVEPERAAGAARSSGQVSGRGGPGPRQVSDAGPALFPGHRVGLAGSSPALGRVLGGVWTSGWARRTGGDNGYRPSRCSRRGRGGPGLAAGVCAQGTVRRSGDSDLLGGFPCNTGRREAYGRGKFPVSEVQLWSRGVCGILCCIRPFLRHIAFFFFFLFCFAFH